MRCLLIRTLWQGMLSVAFFLFLDGGHLWAQTTIYSWTDERGVVHYSNSMAPDQHSQRATSVVLPRTSSARRGEGRIPLVLLNNDPSRKFVRAMLQGERRSREVLMLVDTGAQITLIDESLAQDLDLEHIQDALLRGVTGSAKGWIGRLPKLQLGTTEVRDLPVMVGPRSSHLLLGMDVLEQLSLAVGPRSLQQAR